MSVAVVATSVQAEVWKEHSLRVLVLALTGAAATAVVVLKRVVVFFVVV